MNDRRTIRRGFHVVLAGLLLAGLALTARGVVEARGPDGGGHGHEHRNGRLERTEQSVAFRQDMRKLWEDHVTWTRVVIISVAGGLPDRDAATQRLLQNQNDIGEAVKPFYGDAAGNQLTALLHDHIAIAAEMLDDAKAGDTAAFDDAEARWYANADDIAALLHGANPDQWPLEDLRSMMRTHLDLTLDEAVARLQGRWTDDVAAYDRVHDAILEMADMLSLGIIDQFSKQFR